MAEQYQRPENSREISARILQDLRNIGGYLNSHPDVNSSGLVLITRDFSHPDICGAFSSSAEALCIQDEAMRPSFFGLETKTDAGKAIELIKKRGNAQQHLIEFGGFTYQPLAEQGDGLGKISLYTNLYSMCVGIKGLVPTADPLHMAILFEQQHNPTEAQRDGFYTRDSPCMLIHKMHLRRWNASAQNFRPGEIPVSVDTKRLSNGDIGYFLRHDCLRCNQVLTPQDIETMFGKAKEIAHFMSDKDYHKEKMRYEAAFERRWLAKQRELVKQS